jgi:lysophospholipase L1-like esterase
MQTAPVMLALLLATSFAAAEPTLQFDFGPRGNVGGAPYDAARGYGFEPVSEHIPGERFSIHVPEGNYRITLRIGSASQALRMTIGAESRRLTLEHVATARGEFVERSIVVNVRTASLPAPPEDAPGAAAVRLNPRELGSPTWDDKLTLQFHGAPDAVTSLTVAPVDVPVLYLAGDSTVTDQASSPAASWGQILPRFFDDSIAVANHAESGETLKSFLAELRLDKILSRLRAGDWLLIQFGHNDQKSQWPQTYVEAGTTYRAYLRVYIAEARRRGATPILVTSPERGRFDASGRIIDSHGSYPDAVRAVAREESVALIDLNAMSKRFYEALGPQRAQLAFADAGRDLTHHSNYGAYELARLVVSGILAADPQLIDHLADHLAADAKTFDSTRPDAPETFTTKDL